MANAGADAGVSIGELLEQDGSRWGRIRNLVRAGAIAPARVVRTALQDQASIAVLLITTEVRAAEKPGQEALQPAVTGGGGVDF